MHVWMQSTTKLYNDSDGLTDCLLMLRTMKLFCFCSPFRFTHMNENDDDAWCLMPDENDDFVFALPVLFFCILILCAIVVVVVVVVVALSWVVYVKTIVLLLPEFLVGWVELVELIWKTIQNNCLLSSCMCVYVDFFFLFFFLYFFFVFFVFYLLF